MFTNRMLYYSRLIHCTFSQYYNTLFPPLCVLCHLPTKKSRNICEGCEKDLPILPHSCAKCSSFLPSSLKNPALCGRCLTNPPPYDFTFSLFPYAAQVIQMIVALKFKHDLCYARALGELLTDKIQHTWYKHKPLPDLIIPVSLHPQRLRERGFNQATEIAKPVGKALNIPIDNRGIKRKKSTAAQSGLTKRKRQQNMDNAFFAERSYQDLTVAVLDDVMTTGITMRAFCQVLKQQSAKHIHVWCCARRG